MKPEQKTITRKQSWELYHALGQLSGSPIPAKLAYAVAKNRIALKPEYESLSEASKPPKEVLAKVEQRRMAIARLAKASNATSTMKGGRSTVQFPETAIQSLKEINQKYDGLDDQLIASEHRLSELLKDGEVSVSLIPIDVGALCELGIDLMPTTLEVLIDVMETEEDTKS